MDDLVIPTDWTFKDKNVAEHFDAHVREQLPWYDMATGIVSHFGRHYIPENGRVYDLGASTGNIARALQPTLEARSATYTGIDNSPDMVDSYTGVGEIVLDDVMQYEYEPYDFTVCFLCYMFLPVCTRVQWLHQLVGKIKKGGALVIIDKCVPPKGYTGTAISRLTLAGKRASGVSAEDIIAKELSLCGVQRPIDRFEIPANAHDIFRFGDFAGWLITSHD